ncbi:hypothetical protein ES319_D13G263500v1, partial [Gossypium barbadense]
MGINLNVDCYGSILGVEVDLPTKSYVTELIGEQESKGIGKIARPEDGGFLKPHIFTSTIPQIDGGTNISIKIRWSQMLSYKAGRFSLTVPFCFPEYVTPAIKKISKKEKIELNVNSSVANGILCKATSHPLKEIRGHEGKFSFLYEAEIFKWSNTDFRFSYSVSSGNIFGGILLQSLYDYDQRDMFCIYLFPGSEQNRKVFKKEVFVVDISESMQGRPLESTKSAISAALSKLSPEDSFNIIAFSNEAFQFSTSMELASKDVIERATAWISMKYTVGGSTNLFIPLEKAADMLSNTRGSIPMTFLVTDGSVEDERNICHWMQKRLTNQGVLCPSIHTFGIGSFCNHYFLRMLAMIGQGEYGATFDLDSIKVQMNKLFSKGLSTVHANITIDAFDDCEEIEVYSSRIPDLSLESPLTIYGRYEGSFTMDLKIRRAKDIPLDSVLARRQIDAANNSGLVAKLSIQTCNISEYTRMTLLEKNKMLKALKHFGAWKKKGDPQKTVESEPPEMILLQRLSVGFGDLIATAENIRPGSQEPELPEVAKIFIKTTSNYFGGIRNRWCCMGCIRCCSKMNNQ